MLRSLVGSEMCIRDRLRTARNWFHASQFLPLVLYYLGSSERPTKFPATISFTIRKGLPKWIHHLIWLRGWAHFYAILRRRGSASLRAFCLQMVATGVVCTFICAIGQSEKMDKVHFLTAGLYMLDHILLIDLIGVDWRFRLAFYASFGTMVVALRQKKRIEKQAALPSEGDVGNVELERLRSTRLDTQAHRDMWWYELIVMVCENGLFSAFVSGMTSNATLKAL
eukprot:TRINITY_DN49601_c0_g1_i2.p1 TRINITY_DN49601_c0_g1~~TRINITY_DN49601_c0_g1_i2.p1  ORF type:complete len:241 (+),score=53.93 TRINITY_DN49601_c0_g1_i2:50-724(+)